MRGSGPGQGDQQGHRWGGGGGGRGGGGGGGRAGGGGAGRDAVKTAGYIVKTAVLYNVDVSSWNILTRAAGTGIQEAAPPPLEGHVRTADGSPQKAHRERIRVSTVCAWNTSRLAFDGSGRVKRGKESGEDS